MTFVKGIRESRLVRLLVYPFLSLAALGLIATLSVHVAALCGNAQFFEHSIRVLGPGIFVVWIPTVLIAARFTTNAKQKDSWRAALRGCPGWMQRALWVLFGYAWLGFFVLPLLYGGGMNSSANNARSMSAGMLTFYSIAAGLLYSATRVLQSDENTYCTNGHRISPLAKYCDECGSPASKSSRFAAPDSK